MLVLRIDGVPVAWSRPRKRGAGGYFSPHKETGWYAAVVLHARQGRPAMPRIDPVALDITFFMPRPKKPKHPHWHIVTPDRDNLEKLVADALTDARIIKDDSQICAGEVKKQYPPAGEKPGALIVLRSLP